MSNFVNSYFTQTLKEVLAPFVLSSFESAGTWELNSGDSQYSYIGSRFMNSTGPDTRLVFSPIGWATGARNPIMDVIMGLGDDVSFCYGTRINATYGGPHVMINRSPSLKKISVSTPAPPMNPLAAMFAQFAGAREGEDIQALLEDKSVSKAVMVLNLCVTLTTALLDLSVRIRYKDSYKDSRGRWAFQDGSKDLSTELADIQISHRYVPRRLLALIYHLEAACTWGQLGKNITKGAKITARNVGVILVGVLSTMGSGLIALGIGLVIRGKTDLTTVIIIVQIVLAVIVLILALIAIYA